MIYGTVTPFLILGLPASITYFTPQIDETQKKTLVMQTGILLGLTGLVLGLCLYGLAGVLASVFAENDLKQLLQIFFLYPIFDLPLNVIIYWLVADRKAIYATWVSLINAIAHFGAIVLPVLLGFSLDIVIVSLNSVVFVQFFVFFAFVLLYFKNQVFNWNIGLMVNQLKYSIPLGMSSIMGILTKQLDGFMVAFFFDMQVYAVYINGATEIPLIMIISNSVVAVLTPEFVRFFQQQKKLEILRLWHSSIRKVAIIFFALTSFLFLFGADVIILLFSEKYVESISVFRIYLLLIPLRITQYGAPLIAAGKTSLIWKTSVVGLLINAILNPILIYFFGVNGAAIATVIAVYITVIWLLKGCVSVLQVSWREILPWNKLGSIAIVSLIAASVSWFSIMVIPLSHAILRITVGGILFFFVEVILLISIGGVREDIESMISVVGNTYRRIRPERQERNN